ncbi:hypothetical protein [Microbacterium sp. NPDC087591]|uniref:hypothetical protein n=1 Tax=Microbacterium sp. NPDC087591 TaxID=3364192 RepID=UPI0038307DDE
MNKKVMTLAIVAEAVVGAAGFTSAGLAIGYNIAEDSRQASIENAAQPLPCNLRLAWDRVTQEFQAVYEDSTFVSETPKWGRTANLSCSDAEIADWQEQRRMDGLDDEVCRPMLIDDDASGIVHVDGCAVPVVVAKS